MDNSIAKATLAAVMAASLASTTLPANAAKADREKCLGVVKAGKNDCGNAKHACAGQSTKDGDPSEWISLPKGICERLVNGTVKK